MKLKSRIFQIASIAGLSGLGLLIGVEALAQCTKDIDCSGDLICSHGQCIVSACAKDIDCDGDKICSQGKCTTVQKNEPMCTKDIDCDGDEICSKGKCTTIEEPKPEPRPEPKPEPRPEPKPKPEPKPEPKKATATIVEPEEQKQQQQEFGEPVILSGSDLFFLQGNDPAVRPLLDHAARAGAPVRKAKGGIVTALIFDILGYGFFVGGSAVLSAVEGSLGLVIALQITGGELFMIGSIIGTSSFTARHSAFVDAGYEPTKGRMAAAWTLTSLTIATQGAVIGLGTVGEFETAIAAICVNGVGAILEIINFMSIRPKWNLRLYESVQAQSSRSPIELFPLVSSTRNQAGDRRLPIFGIGGAF